MRTITPMLAAALVLSGGAATAVAQKKTDAYQVTFQSVANSCEANGIDLNKERVVLNRAGNKLTVSIPQIPVMNGTAGKRGNFKARAKRGRTGVAGLEGKFSIAGNIKSRSIEFVFIAEYFQGKSPLCTQSWKGSGTRTTAPARRKSRSGFLIRAVDALIARR